MNATKNHIGKNRNSRRKKTKTASSSVTAICRLDEAEQRFVRNQKRPKKIRSCKPTSNGFLKTTFLPKFRESEVCTADKNVQTKKETEKEEKSFYQSLSELSEHYGLEPMQTQDFDYPYNISLSLWNIEHILQNNVENWNNIQLIKRIGKLSIASEERCDTGTSLFYIPVVPLYKLLKDKKRKKTAHLLLSVCTYLYRNVGVSYYRNEDSYLHWLYEILNDWVEQDDVREETNLHNKELKTAEMIGDFIERKIANSQNLIRFSERLNQFKSENEFGQECFLLAEQVFELYQQYPEEHLYRNAHFNNEVNHQNIVDEEYYNEETVISMDKYISFYADNKGLISDQIIEMVNNEFNEYGEVQEPIVSMVFDGKSLNQNNLDFETRLFELMNQLIYLLSK
ncbi:hypothetical protein [Chryseobacterium sp. MFBS3-17]|uniref:hypothetical protein n=1 Tax=Chryseobacterium sp. MFBS3-17 TaxID=2886689 RepID=UPI001D0E072F|nr:hypothetical protein [Chryseobacterium sp. MFBS3-17]MCC2590295.1 hypothetical protein [Chryseobacterium sp. MFBS3-17]